jgi:hypothetical protein
VLNWLYAICQSELTIALITAGIDPSIGLFHADIPNRPSLALDGIEALRPYVDLWLFGHLVDSVFANRDFTELRDGEVRLTHPLNAHLAHTAALWRQLCEPVADWLKESFMHAAGTSLARTRHWLSPTRPSREPVHRRRGTGSRTLVAPLAPLLPALTSPRRADSEHARGSKTVRLSAPPSWGTRLRDEPGSACVP